MRRSRSSSIILRLQRLAWNLSHKPDRVVPCNQGGEPPPAKLRVDLGIGEHERRDHLSQGRPHLKAMAGTTANNPRVDRLRMAVDNQVRVRCLLRTGKPLTQRAARSRDPGTAPREKLWPERCHQGSLSDPRWSGRSAAPDASSATLIQTNIRGRNSIDLTCAGTRGKVHPYRQVRLREPRVARRRAEVIHLLARWADVGAHDVGKKMWKPRATREYKAIGFENRPIVQPDRVERGAFDSHRMDAGAQPVFPALCHQTVHDVRARASRGKRYPLRVQGKERMPSGLI